MQRQYTKEIEPDISGKTVARLQEIDNLDAASMFYQGSNGARYPGAIAYGATYTTGNYIGIAYDAERRERAERRKRIEEKIAGSIVLSTILGLIALLGSGALNWIHKG